MSYLLLLLLIFLVSFTLGRKHGRTEGLQMGFAKAVIDLRIKSLEQGCCPICQYRATNTGNHGISV